MPSEGREIPSLAVLARSPLFRAGLVALLSAMGYGRVEESSDLKQLKRRVTDARSLEILLLSLPQQEDDLVALIQEIRAWAPKGKVVLLAPAFDMRALSASFAAGAVGYLVERISSNTLQHSLGLVSAGEIVFPSELANALFASASKTSEANRTIDDLRNLHATDQEIEVLRCIANGESNRLIGKRLRISENEVGAHIKHLLKKLRVSNRTQAALWGSARGLATPWRVEKVATEEKEDSLMNKSAPQER